MLKTQFILLVFLGLSLTFVQDALGQVLSSNSSKSSDLEKDRSINISSTNLSDNYNSVNYQDFNTSKSSLVDSSSSVNSDTATTKQKWYKTDTGTSLLIAGGLITARYSFGDVSGTALVQTEIICTGCSEEA